MARLRRQEALRRDIRASLLVNRPTDPFATSHGPGSWRCSFFRPPSPAPFESTARGLHFLRRGCPDQAKFAPRVSCKRMWVYAGSRCMRALVWPAESVSRRCGTEVASYPAASAICTVGGLCDGGCGVVDMQRCGPGAPARRQRWRLYCCVRILRARSRALCTDGSRLQDW